MKIKSSKCRICHLTSVHPYNDTRIFIKECYTLVSHGYEVHFVVPGISNRIIDDIHLHGVMKTENNRISRMFKTVWKVYRKAWSINASIYHFHDPELIPICLLLKMRGKKVIYDIHEDVPRQILYKYWIAKPLRKIISWIVEKIENYAVCKFDGVIAATPFIQERFLPLRFNVVNINNFPISNELYNASENNDKEYAVCYIGVITKNRGIYEMVEAIENTNVKLLLGGWFSPNSERNKLINMPGWYKVEELGRIDRNKVRNILNKSLAGLVVLQPIDNYIVSLPIKMFEYMSAGIPVICSDFPLWKNIIEGNNCGICVNPLDTNEIARAINWIVDHSNEAKRMGENGRKAVVNKYNWEIEKIKLLKLYYDLIEKQN